MEKSRFQFSNPVITDLKFELNNNFSSESETELCNNIKINIIKNDNEPAAIVELSIKVESDENTNNSPFKIDITMKSTFSWDGTYDDELVNSLLTVNAPALLMSYARPIISYITNISPFPVYNLPFYNFVDNNTET